MSRKQEIYRDLLWWGLPYIRNGLSIVRFAPWWRVMVWSQKSSAESYYQIAEFLHNLPVSILTEEFNEHDIWFLNNHVKQFLAKVNSHDCYLYERYCNVIKELFSLVPGDMRDQLEWSGPGD